MPHFAETNTLQAGIQPCPLTFIRGASSEITARAAALRVNAIFQARTVTCSAGPVEARELISVAFSKLSQFYCFSHFASRGSRRYFVMRHVRCGTGLKVCVFPQYLTTFLLLLLSFIEGVVHEMGTTSMQLI